MAKLQVIFDGRVIRECPLTRGRITLGRRKQCNIALDHPAVSGDHAVIECVGRDVYLEDRDSTNGTRLNGKRITRRLKLHFGDTIAIACFTLLYCDDLAPAQPEFQHTLMKTEIRPGGSLVDTRPSIDGQSTLAKQTVSKAGFGVLRVLSGPNVGREVWLKKPVTTLGKSGAEVASIAYQSEGYVLKHVEGVRSPSVNGQDIGQQVQRLQDGDLIDFMGVQMIFALDNAVATDGS